MIQYPLPLLGFCGFSGTGKTTLLSHLLPLLRAQGLRVGMVKHAHEGFDIDHPGKDSQRLREAGAMQMLIASRRRIAWIEELPLQESEPRLTEVLGALDPSRLDLVLVEGFKSESFPKIELHRQVLGQPLIYPSDPYIIAIATDTPLLQHDTPPQLDLNRPEMIARFIKRQILSPAKFRLPLRA